MEPERGSNPGKRKGTEPHVGKVGYVQALSCAPFHDKSGPLMSIYHVPYALTFMKNL